MRYLHSKGIIMWQDTRIPFDYMDYTFEIASNTRIFMQSDLDCDTFERIFCI
jgi:hypothetical protein